MQAQLTFKDTKKFKYHYDSRIAMARQGFKYFKIKLMDKAERPVAIISKLKVKRKEKRKMNIRIFPEADVSRCERVWVGGGGERRVRERVVVVLDVISVSGSEVRGRRWRSSPWL